MIRAIGYIRTSSPGQQSQGHQRTSISAYCEARGLELTGIEEDLGIKGSKPFALRAGGSRVIRALAAQSRRGPVKALVAVKLDRLFRNAGDCLEQTAAWDKDGVSLHLIDLGGNSVDTSTPIGRFFITVMAAAAEMEQGLIGERTKDALAHKRGKGEKTGGAVPFGFQVGTDGRTLEPSSKEFGVFKKIIKWRLEGKHLKTIADTLNRENVPARGRRWHLTTIERIIGRYKRLMLER